MSAWQDEIQFQSSLQIDELDDLSTEMERRLGALVKQKYGSDFYIMYGYPMEVSRSGCSQGKFMALERLTLNDMTPESRTAIL